MAFIYNMKVSMKLIVSFLIVALLVGLVGVIGVVNLEKVDSNGSDLYEEMLVPTESMAMISTSFQRQRVELRQLLLSETQSEKQAEAAKILQRREEINQWSDEFEALINDDEMQALFDAYAEARSTMAPLLDDAVAHGLAGENDLAWELMRNNGALGIASSEMQAAIADLLDMKVEDAGVMNDDNKAITSSAVKQMIAIIAAAVLIAIALALFLSKLIGGPLLLVTDSAKKLAVGDVELNIVQKSKDEVGQLMGAFAEVIDNIKEQSRNALEISKGNLDLHITPKSDKDVLSLGMKTVVESLNSLVDEAAMLTEAAVEGRLATRGDDSKYEGGYKQIVAGVNETLDAVIGPLNVTADYVEKISRGEIPSKITDQYNGDFNIIKQNLNQCIDAVNLLVSDAGLLVDAAIGGRLKTRADAAKHQGDYRKIVQGVNDTLDAVIKPVEEAADVLAEMAKGNMKARVVGNYQGDHAAIKDALNFMGETIGGYLDEIAEQLGKMAMKDFTSAITREYLGDFMLLKDSINNIIDQFNVVMQEINAAAEQVEAASEQVASSSQALSQGSSEQASSVEEVSSSMTQVAEQTKQNATNANKANELSNNAKNDATKGNAQMTDMLSAMNEIKESSKNIANIIKVIDDIAFQTNILALNAAVEAARAGEHGKGFAVVAEEVRNLAARSASAAKETTEMIDNSINKVNEGYEIANSTAAALNQIVGGVTDAVDIVGMIADASNEQASAIGQINEGVEQISQVTQTNMATAEESASASEELASHAQMLKQLIDDFRLRGAKKKTAYAGRPSMTKEAATSLKGKTVEISLDDEDFGKY